MVLVFIFLAILIIITLIICMTILSTLKIKVKNLELSNIQKQQDKVEQSQNEKQVNSKGKYQVIISLYLFDKIKWLSIHLNNQKIRKMYSKAKSKEIDFKKVENDFNFKLEDLKLIKTIIPKISYLDLQVNLGTEDVVTTSFTVFTISTIISIILPYIIKKYEKDKYYYEIKPLYMNQNVYRIKFSGIFEVKMVHIINIVYVLLKRRVDKNERTSNRRTYGYSYE